MYVGDGATKINVSTFRPKHIHSGDIYDNDKKTRSEKESPPSMAPVLDSSSFEAEKRSVPGTSKTVRKIQTQTLLHDICQSPRDAKNAYISTVLTFKAVLFVVAAFTASCRQRQRWREGASKR